MKRRFISFICILAIVSASVCTAFAGGLEVTKITPKDGAKGTQPANMAVKVTFSETMVGGSNNVEANASKFKITNAENKEQPFTMVYSEKYPDQLWLILDESLEADSTYTITVDSGITSASGSTTSEKKVTSFSTRNVKRDSLISTIMMMAMMAFIFIFSARSTKKAQAENQTLTVAQAEKLNPYKIAKAKGIKLEEAEEYVRKEKEKARKAEEKVLEIKRQKEAMAAAELAAIEAEVDSEERRNGWFRVKTVGSFKEHGHAIPKYVKKKNAAKRKAAEERAKKYAKNKKKK